MDARLGTGEQSWKILGKLRGTKLWESVEWRQRGSGNQNQNPINEAPSGEWYAWVGYGPGTLKSDFSRSPHRTMACRRLRRCSTGRGRAPAQDSSRLCKSSWLAAGELRVSHLCLPVARFRMGERLMVTV